MNKKELQILEKAFASEINYSLGNAALPLLQTKSKLAEKLANEGYLQRVTARIPGKFTVSLRGYLLTHAGRATYCASCSDDESDESDENMEVK